MPIRRSACALSLLVLGAGPVLSQDPQPQPPPGAAEAAGEEQIVVNGRIKRCRPLEDEPLDLVSIGSQHGRRMVLKPDGKGVWKLRRDDDPVTGPVAWQRAGTAVGDYVYANPTDGGRLCIGAKAGRPGGYAQLRRVLDARPFRGKYVVLTAYTMASRAGEARFWLAAGDNRRIYTGGDTRLDPILGTTDWVPVQMTIGPIPRQATKLSYGFLLHGRGDVWVDDIALQATTSVEREPGAIRLSPVM